MRAFSSSTTLLVVCVATVCLSTAAPVQPAAAAPGPDFFPTWAQTASYARWLVDTMTYGSLGTQSKDMKGYAFASEEDISASATLQAGNFFLILPGMSAAHQNLLQNSMATMSIAMTNCSAWNAAGMPSDILDCPRCTVYTDFSMANVTMEWPTTNPDLLAYAKRHPAFIDYLQGGTIHKWYLWQSSIKRIFWTGGYGSIHNIGELPLDLFWAATPHSPP